MTETRTIDELQQENERLRLIRAQLDAQAKAKREREDLETENQKLRNDIERLKREVDPSSASGAPQP